MSPILKISIPAKIHRDKLAKKLHLFQETEELGNTVVLTVKLAKPLRAVIINYKLNDYPITIQNPTSEIADLLSDIYFSEIWLDQAGEYFKVEFMEQLRNLRELTISDRDEVDFSALEAFSELEDLHLENLPSLTRLDQIPALPCLKLLTIRACPNLTAINRLSMPRN